MSRKTPDSAPAGREASLPARLVAALLGAGTRALQLVAAVLLFGREASLPARLVTGLPGAGTRVLQLVAAILLLVMMTVTFVDVIGRYLFNAPLPGAFELTEVLLALVVFVGLPIVTARREHVTVDLLTGRLPGGLRAALAWLATLATGLVLALLAWRLATSARDFSAYGDATVYLGIPLGPVAGIMAGLTGLAALVAGVLLFRRN